MLKYCSTQNKQYCSLDDPLRQGAPYKMNTSTQIHEMALFLEAHQSLRIDKALAQLWPQYSRACLQKWLKDGAIKINGKTGFSASARVQGGEQVELNTELASQNEWLAEAITLNIVFEDEDILLINKPAGLVVHPAPGHYQGTLVNAVLAHVPAQANLPRAGIIHRLDKDTTGLLVIAKNLVAHHHLVGQLQARTMGREYDALVQGALISGGTVDEPIGRHHKLRTHMAVTTRGRAAVTHYRIQQRFRAHTLLRVKLETGRTHQIRVHMAHIGYSLVGDPMYSRLCLPKGATEEVRNALRTFPRQALHARYLQVVHPRTQQTLAWEAPLPEDMQSLLNILKSETLMNGNKGK